MTKTFTRFLRSFSDEELVAFAQDRSVVRPPYWKLMQVALRIELDRRHISPSDETLLPTESSERPASTGHATA